MVARHIDLAALAGLISDLYPRGDGRKGWRSPYPTEIMVRFLVLKHLYELSNEQIETDCLIARAASVFACCKIRPMCPTATPSVNSSSASASMVPLPCPGAWPCYSTSMAIERALVGRAVDATLLPASRPHVSKEERESLSQGATPVEWGKAKRWRKDLDARRPHPIRCAGSGSMTIRTHRPGSSRASQCVACPSTGTCRTFQSRLRAPRPLISFACRVGRAPISAVAWSA